MNFHETKMGSIFFNSQLPQLTRALQEIASALSKPAPAIKLDGTADPELLHNLFYALYEPEIYGNRESISANAASCNYVAVDGDLIYLAYGTDGVDVLRLRVD